MQTVKKAIKAVENSAVERQETRDNSSMPVGYTARQGDLYITKVKSHKQFFDLVKFNERGLITKTVLGKKTANPQLAPGTSKGSRHCVASKDLSHVTLYAPHKDSGALQGPTITAKADFTVEHPEHGHHSFSKGTYVCHYQLDARTMGRVRD